MDWEAIDLESLVAQIRRSCAASEAERMAWAFEHVLALARRDPELLPSVFAATASLLAWAEGMSPRSLLEIYFRRAVSDEKWRELYLPLFR